MKALLVELHDFFLSIENKLNDEDKSKLKTLHDSVNFEIQKIICVEKETQIRDFVRSIYPDNFSLAEEIDERIFDYIDYEQMEEEGIEDEHEYYLSYGRGEAESSIFQEILEKIASFINEPIDEWYFNEKYCDIDSIIYEIYPELNVA